MKNQITLKISPELKERITNIAKREGKEPSDLVIELLEEYIKDRDIGAYIDDLWARINRRLTKRGVELSDVSKAVNSSRN